MPAPVFSFIEKGWQDCQPLEIRGYLLLVSSVVVSAAVCSV